MSHYLILIVNMNRKEFIKRTGRLLLLGGITATSGYLILNKKVTASCTKSDACSKCGEFAKCELPQAQQQKENTEKR